MKDSGFIIKLTLIFCIVLLLSGWAPINYLYGAEIRKVPVGFAALDIKTSQSNPNIMYACDFGGVYRSEDAGNSWSQIVSGWNAYGLEIDPGNANIVYVTWNDYMLTGNISVSENGGGNWEERGWNDIGFYFIKASPNPPYPVYSTPENTFKVSYDHAQTWKAIYPAFLYFPISIAFVKGNDSTIYVGTYKKGVWVSKDNAATWDSLGLGGYKGEKRIAVNPIDPNIIYTAVEGYDLFKTENGGVEWRALDNGLTGKQFTRLLLSNKNPSQLFLSTSDSGLFVTNNAGNSWQRLTAIPQNANVAALAFDEQNGRLFFSLLNEPYVYIVDVDSIFASVENRRRGTPYNFQLLQNYPNPLNAETWIQYTLPTPANIRLDIYDTTGRRIRTLLNGRQSSGQKRVKWDGRDSSRKQVSSGVYVYRLRAGGKSLTRKLLLVR
ncbi:MAG: T9SS type A sorting domain-containing protein [Actinobacteria bacterium]|nr:T9SS type A sorting domain-containing protein [Actinomycetota bacterium]